MYLISKIVFLVFLVWLLFCLHESEYPFAYVVFMLMNLF